MKFHIKKATGPGLFCGAVKGMWTYAHTVDGNKDLCPDCLNSEDYALYLLSKLDEPEWTVERRKYYGTTTGRLPFK